MSELTHINCVALTARFPVGKPVVPAALMNRATRGGEGVCELGALPLPSLTDSLRSGRPAAGSGISSLKGGNTGYPRNPGITRERTCEQKGSKKAGTRKKGRVCGRFSIGSPPPGKQSQKTNPPSQKGGKTRKGKKKKSQGVFPPWKTSPPGASSRCSQTPGPL
eukprot:FR737029.1.p1 GENE.FR737029.1~~FR737029.1.p1  ORF type:complete len:164 (+),score=36.36 FR737029.1:637-1128(+)